MAASSRDAAAFEALEVSARVAGAELVVTAMTPSLPRSASRSSSNSVFMSEASGRASSSAGQNLGKDDRVRANTPLATGEARRVQEAVWGPPEQLRSWRSCGELRTCDAPPSAAMAERAPADWPSLGLRQRRRDPIGLARAEARETGQLDPLSSSWLRLDLFWLGPL